MKIDRLILGDYQTNCYILRSSGSETDCLVIDTGLETDQPAEYLRENGLNPIALFLTHAHADHIGGVNELRQNFADMKIHVHRLDSQMLSRPAKNLSLMTGRMIKTVPADFFLEDGQTLQTAGIKIKTLHTPGHTPGGVSLYLADEAVVFTGDALFADSVGRTDFPGGDMTELIKSIKDKLCTLPGDTIVYPGHGPQTTIAHEKANNQFLR